MLFHPLTHRWILAAALCASAGLQAQTVYRIVGPDGKVTFSDKPPVSAEQGKVSTTGVGAAAVASGTELPLELRQAVSKYPVTLYTSADCTPCGAGRSLLVGRGVPFSERTISTAEDIAALQRLTGQNSLPFLTIGPQKLNGFSSDDWGQYLDAAGYPKTSQLSPAYRNPAPSPLVATQRPTTKPEAKPEAPGSTPAPGPNTSNPAGIQF